MKLLKLLLISFISFITAAQDIDISEGNIFEGEPFLVVNPNNSQNLAIAWMGYKFGSGIVIKTKTSSDGGNTWANEVEHIQEIGNAMADPILAYNSANELFLCYIDYDNENFLAGQISLKKSIDNGINWGNSVEVINISDCSDKLCIDRPWMVIDNSGGINDGTIYISSMNADNPAIVTAPYNPYVTVSTNGGNSFETPKLLDANGFLAGSTIKQPMPSPIVTANGTFKAIYPSYETNQSIFAQLIIASSNNQTIDLAHNIAYQGGGLTAHPSAKVAGHFNANPANENHIIYTHLRSINGDLDIYMRESFNAGLSWTNEIRINDDPIANGVDQDLVWTSFDSDGDLAVSWRDRRNGGEGFEQASEIYAAIRWKDAINFEPNFRLNDSLVPFEEILNSSGNDFMNINFVNDTLHAAWGDVRTGTINIWYTRYAANTGTAYLQSINSINTLNIYPNLAESVINIDTKENLTELRALSITGQEFPLKAINNRIDISALAAGQYFLFSKSESGKIYQAKFIRK